MDINTENYLAAQYHKYFDYTPYEEYTKEYEYLYKSCPNDSLKHLLSALHADINRLFKEMNSRLPTQEFVAHFWADPSRELLDVIDTVYSLQSNLNTTEISFLIDDYYDDLLKNCRSWLSRSGGSKIPPYTPSVDLYYIKPIFIFNNARFQSELLPKDETLELLGQGGFGEVYKYHHPFLDIDFAVKYYSPIFANQEDEEKGEKRFFREAKMLFQLNHPNIVRIYDIGRSDDKPFIKMEYIEGMTLESLLKEHGLFSPTEACKAMKQVLSGLDHAHKIGIIHRDLKPSNIMVKTIGNRWQCKIIDFGISAFMESEGYTQLTKTNEKVGGGRFLDPLLLVDSKMRDPRSDIYSVGAIMYCLIVGQAPGVDAEKQLRERCPNIDNEIISIIMKAMSSDIDQRYNDCEEMISSIDKAIGI